MAEFKHVPLVEIVRGSHLESVHFGSAVVVDAHGEVIFAAGDIDFLTFTRSTLKPFQAMPFFAGEGSRKFGFGLREQALMCASHSGELMHTHLAHSMLQSAGCDEHHLRCGCHVPSFYAHLNKTVPNSEVFNQLHNNCSGKHVGFLAYCVEHNLPLDSYLDPTHALQKAIVESVAYVADVRPADLARGIDGCSAPNYALPLNRLALMYARLARGGTDARYGNALETAYAAMTTHPELVSGTARFDDAVMRTGAGDWVAKAGAEGVQVIGVRSRGWGIAVKVIDGNVRGLHAAVIALLEHVGLLTGPAPLLDAWRQPAIMNASGLEVGSIRSVGFVTL